MTQGHSFDTTKMDTNITVIGAGVVGLAIASELSRDFDSIFVLEKNRKFGQETSSRNSEVVHSGIYYPQGSLKAKLCIQGKDLLYKYCNDNEIPHKKCGKMIISNSSDDVKVLSDILSNATNNGVTDGRIIEREEIEALEPHIKAVRGLYFPTSGIIDSHSLMKQLETDSINSGCEIVYGSQVTGICKLDQGYKIYVSEGNGTRFTFSTRYLINSAGLDAEKIALMVGIRKDEYKVYYWKGEYFSIINGKHKLISRLIYPVPEENTIGLGIHTTVDMSGRAKLGPNTVFINNNIIDYTIEQDHRTDFYLSASKFLPFLELNDLVPDMVGIRPKLQKPGDPVRDFVIREESPSGFPGFINLLGIESPGLTACLSIAKYVKQYIG